MYYLSKFSLLGQKCRVYVKARCTHVMGDKNKLWKKKDKENPRI